MGILRSLLIYYCIPFRIRRLSRFYSQFIQTGDLCFDVGAHVGNRTLAFRRLGARVVAIEPQPVCVKILSRFYGRDHDVVIVPKAVGAKTKDDYMYISKSTPTVSTLSKDWIESIKMTKNFNSVIWEEEIIVSTTTLEALILEFGVPIFTKIDVEGFEYEVFNGLIHELPLISFEYLAIASQRAIACIKRLRELGDYEYNWTVKEKTSFNSPVWVSGWEMITTLRGMHEHSYSGDIYCRSKDIGCNNIASDQRTSYN